MKTLYFECSSGISGNMTLGALLELIDDRDYLINELNKLNVSGYKLDISSKIKNGITGTYVDVILDNVCDHEHSHNHDHNHDHDHDHDHDYNHSHEHHHEHNHIHHHEHRNLYDVNKIIDESELSEDVKDLSKRIFMRVALAESKVHNKPIEEVHFHEVGALDSIVDIIGTAILIDKIKPDKVIASVINDGYGFIHCAHGMISVPVPATSEIFAAANVKFRQIDIETELVTPTGAAIIAELASDFTTMPAMKVSKIGWGCGSKELKIPNVLKVSLGELSDDSEAFVVMETNIDDCSGEVLGYVQELLFNAGALDVFYTPVFMKKNRPAYQLTVACDESNMSCLQNIIFRETTTIGIRYRYEKRAKLKREIVDIDTSYGKIEAKKVVCGDNTFIYPEYESIKKIAKDNDIPLKELMKLEEFKTWK